jgi:hypothetical protein
MPVKLRATPRTPVQIMNAEIREFEKLKNPGAVRQPSSIGEIGTIPMTDDAAHTRFLTALCQAFQNTVRRYFDASPDAATRLQRLAEIKQTFADLCALLEQQDFSAEARSAKFERAARTDATDLPADLNEESQQTELLAKLGEEFQDKALEFYRKSPDATRLQLVAALSQTFRELHFVDDAQDANAPSFTTAALSATMTAEEAWKSGGEGCPEGTTCIDRNCIPNPPPRRG